MVDAARGASARPRDAERCARLSARASSPTGRATKYDVACSGLGLSTGVVATRANDQVSDAIAIDIARAADGSTCYIKLLRACEHETLASVTARIGIQPAARRRWQVIRSPDSESPAPCA